MPQKRMTANSKGFHQGIVYSAAIIVSQFDQPGDAKDLLVSAGISRSVAVKAGCDQYDMDIIDQANAWPKPSKD
jgi:hypothetical protein